MYSKDLYRFLIILFISASFLGLIFGCTSSKTQTSTYGSSYDPYKLQTIDEIQYKSAYKYDVDGKKYKKHYRQKRRREN
jgi:hypothetical protein